MKAYYSKEIPPLEGGVILSYLNQEDADKLARDLWDAVYGVE
jgi:hypothetical protein